MYPASISQFVSHHQSAQEVLNFSITDITNATENTLIVRTLRFRVGLVSDYSKQIDIVPIVNISVRFVGQIIK